MVRLTSRVLVDLLIRKTRSAGGFAAVLAVGDDHGGTILIQCRDREETGPLLEKQYGPGGQPCWVGIGPAAGSDPQIFNDYYMRRRKSDPDLWLIELDIAAAPQFIAEWTALA